MTMLEIIIKGLTGCLKGECPKDCPYIKEDCPQAVARDALELLKEREPQPAIIEDFDVVQFGRCPSCNVVLQPWGANYCYKCGKGIKWND